MADRTLLRNPDWHFRAIRFYLREPVVRTTGSLYWGATRLNSRADSFLCIYQWCRSCCWWFSDAPTQTTPFCIHLALLWTLLTNLQTSFNTIQHSFRDLQLLLNASKTKCSLFNRLLPVSSRPTSITTLDGSDREYVDNYKYLGVWLDCKLSFQTHIKHLQSKVTSRIGFLFRGWLLDPPLRRRHHSVYIWTFFGHCWQTQTPYLSSLVTIAAPTRSTHSSRYISLVTPKANSSFVRLSF